MKDDEKVDWNELTGKTIKNCTYNMGCIHIICEDGSEYNAYDRSGIGIQLIETESS